MSHINWHLLDTGLLRSVKLFSWCWYVSVTDARKAIYNMRQSFRFHDRGKLAFSSIYVVSYFSRFAFCVVFWASSVRLLSKVVWVSQQTFTNSDLSHVSFRTTAHVSSVLVSYLSVFQKPSPINFLYASVPLVSLIPIWSLLYLHFCWDLRYDTQLERWSAVFCKNAQLQFLHQGLVVDGGVARNDSTICLTKRPVLDHLISVRFLMTDYITIFNLFSILKDRRGTKKDLSSVF